MSEIIANLSVTYNQQFRMKFMTSKGFHIQLALSKGGQLPVLDPSFEVMSKTKNTINLTTQELRMLNLRMFDVVQQIQMESNRLISVLINGIRQNMSHLYDLAGLVSSLDIMLSLAKYSINSNGCCPLFSSEMNVIDGIHPLLEHNRTKTKPVPNGVIANNEYHFFVITGPNMGGKTVYLKMIAVLQILAQIGCFVPAKSAQFRLTDKILSRIGFSDRIECNLSGFVLEMRETEYIFKNITPNSLVIIDELCRSTNPEESEVLAWDICERFVRLIGVSNDGQHLDEAQVPAATSKTSNKSINLCSITSPFIFFVTHFDSITKLQDKFLSVVNLHFSANEEVIDGKIHLNYDYRIVDGVNQIKNYGISLAQYMNFPSDVITKATHMSEQLRQKQLPAPSRNSNLHFENSSSNNKRSAHPSTILESSTSEQSHILRLFYNLYADMNSINRMTISVDEKTELLNRKMSNLRGELPSHVLETAKKGTLFEIFKPSQRVPVHGCTDRNVSHSSADTHGSTHLSVLSEHSSARRAGWDERERYNIHTPLTSLELSNREVENAINQHQSFEHSFRKNRIQNFPSHLELNFDENEFIAPFDAIDSNTNFMASDMNIIAKDQTPRFGNLSPEEDEMVVKDKPVIEEFFYSPGIIKNTSRHNNYSEFESLHIPNKVQPAVSSNVSFRSKFIDNFKPSSSVASSSSSPQGDGMVLRGTPAMDELFYSPGIMTNMSRRNNYGEFGSLRTLNKVQPVVSANVSFKSKLSNNLKPSPSASSASASSEAATSSLFRLKLKQPVKSRDNRILKTPPKILKSLHRTSNTSKRKLTFSGLKDQTTKHQSSFQVNFSSVDTDKSLNVRIPSARRSGSFTDSTFHEKPFDVRTPLARSSGSFSESILYEKPFHLNLTQYCSSEAIDERSFFDSTQDLLVTDRRSVSSNKQKDIISTKITPPRSLHFNSFDHLNITAVPSQVDSLQFDRNLSHQLENVIDPDESQAYSENINDFSNIESEYFKDLDHQSNQLTFNQFDTPKKTPSSALQFIQRAYESQADTDSDNDIRSDIGVTVVASQREYVFSNKMVSNSQKSSESTFLQNVAVSGSDKIIPDEDAPTSHMQQDVTKTDCSANLNRSKSLDDINENLDDLILPAPSPFL